MTHKGGHGENLIGFGLPWVEEKIDHFDRVPARKVLFTDAPDIGK
jgi:hypothetical protein